MPKNYFLLCSTDEQDHTTFWSVEEGWTREEGAATRYDSSILAMGSTLPVGVGAIIEVNAQGQWVNYFAPLSLPLWVGCSWFEASCFA